MSPRTPCAAPKRATRTLLSFRDGASAPDPESRCTLRVSFWIPGSRPSAVPRNDAELWSRRCFSRRATDQPLRRGGGSGAALRSLFGARLALLARDRLFRIVARLALGGARGIEEAHHAVGRLRALLHPGLRLFQIE